MVSWPWPSMSFWRRDDRWRPVTTICHRILDDFWRLFEDVWSIAALAWHLHAFTSCWYWLSIASSISSIHGLQGDLTHPAWNCSGSTWIVVLGVPQRTLGTVQECARLEWTKWIKMADPVPFSGLSRLSRLSWWFSRIVVLTFWEDYIVEISWTSHILVIRASPFAPGITHLEVNSLVRVHDRRRGTVTKIETNSKVATSNPHRQQSRGAKITYESAHECPSIGLERGEMESTRIHLCAALLV